MDKNFQAYWEGNHDLFLSVALVMGTFWLGDGSTIGKAPLINIMGEAGDIPLVVVGILDCTQQLVEGGKKDARFMLNCSRITWKNYLRIVASQKKSFDEGYNSCLLF